VAPREALIRKSCGKIKGKKGRTEKLTRDKIYCPFLPFALNSFKSRFRMRKTQRGEKMKWAFGLLPPSQITFSKSSFTKFYQVYGKKYQHLQYQLNVLRTIMRYILL
jgi:hypothetical protein